MSGIIQVDYTAEGKTLTTKLKEHLGIHKLDVQLKTGTMLSGLLTELGENYLILMEDSSEVIISSSEVVFFRYKGQ